MLLLLVDDNKPQVFHRREHRRTGPHHDGCLSPANPLPLIQPFSQREAAVEQRHFIPEPAAELTDGLAGKGDLRHHDNDAFPLIPHLLDKL